MSDFQEVELPDAVKQQLMLLREKLEHIETKKQLINYQLDSLIKDYKESLAPAKGYRLVRLDLDSYKFVYESAEPGKEQED